MGLLLDVITGLLSLVPALSPVQQNGASLLGTLQAPVLPAFLTDNPLTLGFPWGLLSAKASNPYTEAPFTGVTRNYKFVVTRGFIAPDGYNKSVILINGQFPGPTIQANWGDQIQVTVTNNIYSPSEGIGFHWHGILQKKTPYYDGVASVQQCPIAPGSTFTYNFQADLYGTSWYHSHYSSQYAGGLLGPMVIYGPKNADYDIDLGPVFLTGTVSIRRKWISANWWPDYYHRPYYDIVKDTLTNTGDFSKIIPFSDNNLINGKMNFDCSLVTDGTSCTPNAGLSKFKFKKGKTHRLRLINAGADALQRFSIDGHSMTVIAYDFVEIKPYTTNVVTLGVGQRADVLVTANGKYTDAVWMRANISTICSKARQPNALAAIYYDFADSNAAPTSQAWNAPDPGTCMNDDLSLTEPYYPLAPVGAVAAVTTEYNIGFAPNASGVFLWSVNKQTFRGNYNQPVLLLANQGNFSFPKEWNVYNYGTNESITFVINNPPGFPPHPMHMHGHNFWILSEGPGAWDGKTIKGNPNNPMRRDVQQIAGGSHLVIQFKTDNPSAWGLHCHIAWHASNGFYITILERPDKIQKMQIPESVRQTCRE